MTENRVFIFINNIERRPNEARMFERQRSELIFEKLYSRRQNGGGMFGRNREWSGYSRYVVLTGFTRQYSILGCVKNIKRFRK